MRFTTPQEWLAWMERLHHQEIDLGLDRVARVWRRLGLDLSASRVVSVAGTNGKGSSVALLESIYRAAGYSVGAYTSPHLERYNERIRLDGEMIDDARLCEAFEAVDQVRTAGRDEVSLSYFEFGTLAALWLFARAQPDLVLLEVGLGGRLDAVNIIDADIALITPIDRDHEAWLGTEIDQIAREKAGILRPGHPAVYNGDRPPAGLAEVAAELGANLLWRGHDYHLETVGDTWSWSMGETVLEHLPLPALAGRHQVDNAAAVLAVVDLLGRWLPLERGAIEAGLKGVFVPGRLQRVPGEVDVILDVAHNPHGARALAAALGQECLKGQVFAVFGILSDKDLGGVVEPFRGKVDAWFLGRPDCERGRAVEELTDEMAALEIGPIISCPGIAEAYRAARERARPGDTLLVFGSFYTVSEVMGLL